MKTESIEELAAKGPVMILEFRGSKDETISWTDKKTGQARSMQKRTFFCETTSNMDGSTEVQQIAVEQFPERGKEGLPEVPNFMQRGKLFLVCFESYQERQGTISARASKFLSVGTPEPSKSAK